MPQGSEAAWQAQVQAVLASGDAAVGEVLLAQTRPNPRRLLRDMAMHEVDAERYLQAQPAQQPLPWDIISLDASCGAVS